MERGCIINVDFARYKFYKSLIINKKEKFKKYRRHSYFIIPTSYFIIQVIFAATWYCPPVKKYISLPISTSAYPTMPPP